MKENFFKLIYILIITTNCFGQEVNIPIKISDGISADTLRFGLDPAATNGIDISLNENELPPLPPSGIFDARFIGAGLTPPVPIGNGLQRDYREGSIPYFGVKNHRIKYQVGSGSAIIISWWNIPFYISIRIQDIITGNLIDTTFTTSGSYIITNPLGFSSLNFTVNYDFPTSVGSEPGKNEMPESLSLFQNYPNPFNPVTTINYYLPKMNFVKLSVYNSSGKLQMVLNNSGEAAGFHSVIFDASGLSSGIYFYEIQAGEYSVTKRMLLIK